MAIGMFYEYDFPGFPTFTYGIFMKKEFQN